MSTIPTFTIEEELIERLWAELRDYRRVYHQIIDNNGQPDEQGPWVSLNWLPVEVMHRADATLKKVSEWRKQRLIALGNDFPEWGAA